MTTNPLEKFDKSLEKFVEDKFDNVVYGKNENIFERNARRQKEKEADMKTYGKCDGRAVTWVPGIYAYKNIRETLKNTDYTRKEKISRCSLFLAGELALDAIRIGTIYGLYEINRYVNG